MTNIIWGDPYPKLDEVCERLKALPDIVQVRADTRERPVHTIHIGKYSREHDQNFWCSMQFTEGFIDDAPDAMVCLVGEILGDYELLGPPLVLDKSPKV